MKPKPLVLSMGLKEKAILAAYLLNTKWVHGPGLRPHQFFHLSRVYQLVFPSPTSVTKRNFWGLAKTAHHMTRLGLLTATEIDVEYNKPKFKNDPLGPKEMTPGKSHAFRPTEAGLVQALSVLNVRSLSRRTPNVTRHNAYHRTTVKGVNPAELIHLITDDEEVAQGLFLGVEYTQMDSRHRAPVGLYAHAPQFNQQEF